MLSPGINGIASSLAPEQIPSLSSSSFLPSCLYHGTTLAESSLPSLPRIFSFGTNHSFQNYLFYPLKPSPCIAKYHLSPFFYPLFPVAPYLHLSLGSSPPFIPLPWELLSLGRPFVHRSASGLIVRRTWCKSSSRLDLFLTKQPRYQAEIQAHLCCGPKAVPRVPSGICDLFFSFFKPHCHF